MWTVLIGSRRSLKQSAMRSNRRIRRARSRSNRTPASDVISPPSKAANTTRLPKSEKRILKTPCFIKPRLPVSPSLRAVPTTRADRNGCIRRLLPRSTRPSPNLSRVGVHIFTFEACSGFTRVRPARSLNRPRRPLSQGFGPAGYPTRPPVSYQIKPTTVWVDPSSTGVTRRRGALRSPGSMNRSGIGRCRFDRRARVNFFPVHATP